MNRSPFGPLLQVTCGNVGTPKFGPAWLGVSSTSSVPPQPVPSSPQMWHRFSQWPISWVVVRPRSNGAAAVPVVPKPLCRMTTPSVSAGPARELRVAEQAAAELADPDVEVAVGRPGVDAAGGAAT